MTNYLVRVELVDVECETDLYTKLHAAMEAPKVGFHRKVNYGGKVCALPHAEYLFADSGDKETTASVGTKAKTTAESVHSDVRVTSLKVGEFWAANLA